MKYDVVVIGGGHNGLAAAAYLARAGRKVLVLERRHVLGGAAVTEEVFKGFKFSVCSYVVSLLRPEIIRELDLPAHGLEILPLDGTFTPMPDGNYLWRTNDHAKTRREIARHSRLDAEAYDEYGRAMVDMGRFVKPILNMLPPDPMSLDPRQLRKLLWLAQRFRGLSRQDQYNQLQLMTMSASDFLDQWFETDVLKATMAASGIIGTFLGVRSPGTAYVLLHHYMGEIDGAFRSWGLSRGGTGAISNAIAGAARKAGVEIRAEAEVARILVRGNKARGVVLRNGDEIVADVIASSVDPRLTFLRFLESGTLPDDFLEDVHRYKFRGSSGKVNLALDALPDFRSLPGPGPHLRGAISISPSVEYMERAYDAAKYGHFSPRPYIDIVIPSLTDPSVAPPGKHVMSCFVQYAPYHLSEGSWDEKKEQFGDTVIKTIEEYAPNIRNIVLHRQVVTPLDLEREWGLSEGNIFQGELTLEQLFFLRPAPGWSQYPNSGQRPVYVRIGHASRRRHHGRTGAERGHEDPRGHARVSGPVIIGAGHNGLAAAYYLARGGLKPIVLEGRPTVGGGAITTEIHSGFKCPTLTHHTCLHADIARDMNLARHGVEYLAPAVNVFSPSLDSPALILAADPSRTRDALRHLSVKDADAYPAYCATLARIAGALAPLLTTRPPDIDRPGGGDLWNLLRFGQRFRRLGTRDAYRLLRWAPMPIADLVSESFENDLLRAAVSAPGLSGTMLGPRSAGSGLVFLLQQAHQLSAGGATRVHGGPGALTSAMAAAARAAGADIRTNARVERIVISQNKVVGVVADGRELPATTVVSAIDPKSTFLRLVDPTDLAPDFRSKVENYRAMGTVAKVNLALSALPAFHGARDASDVLSGRIHIGPTLDYMERAFDRVKYGELPEQPWLDATIPSVLDPDLAPRGAHVMSLYVHYTAYRLRSGEWAASKESLLRAVLDTLDAYAPGMRTLVVAAQVLTPADLESEHGFFGGHVFHGELALDQLFVARPLLGCARYDSPVGGLYLCGAGTHPGGFLTGVSGKLAAREVLSRKAGA